VPPKQISQHFRLTDPAQIDTDFIALLREAYDMK